MAIHKSNRFDNLVESIWFPWIDLVFVSFAGILWIVGQRSLTWQPLLIALLPWVLRLATGHFPFRRTPLDFPMLAFLFSAGVGVWTAYDRSNAWAKFWLLVGAILLFYALAGQSVDNLWPIVGVLGFSGVLIGGYFLLTHDWQAFPAKYDTLNQTLLRWMTLRPKTYLAALPPNVAASLMAISLPLLLAWGYHLWYKGRKVFFATAIGAIGFVSVILLLTTSRGAWIALGVAAGIGLFAWISGKLASQIGRPRSLIFVLLLLLALVISVLFAVLYPGGPVALIDQLPGPASGTSRYVLIQNTLDLIRDFPITGGGLRSFPGLYSQYILVIPFFVLPNGHNIFLDTALEQGPLGIIAMATIFLGSFVLLFITSKTQEVNNQDYLILCLAVGISLVIMLVHGFVEDTVYGNPGSFFLFVLPGLAVAVTLTQGQVITDQVLSDGWVVGGMLLVLIVLFMFWLITTRQSLTSTWLANLGAVKMAQVELAEWPTNKWDDGSNVGALRLAEDLFKRSLAAGDNRTAHHRLGLTAMLRRDFEQAVTYLEVANNRFNGLC